VVRDLKKRLEEIEKNISAFEENIKLASAQIGENDAAARKAEAEIAELEAERAHLEKDLQTITDDIVAALDAGLKNAGYSAAERRRTEEAVAEVLQRLKTMLAGRETMLRDLAAMVDRAMQGGQAIQPSELRRLAESLAAALAEGAAQAEKAHELFESYRKASPSFIDEFLAPEGIITRKRALDEKINSLKEAVRQRRERIMALRSENDGLGLKIEEYRKTLEDLRVNRVRMATQAQSAEEQARLIRRELAGQEALLKTVQDELFLDRKRFDEIAERIEDAEADIAEIERRGRRLTEELENLERDIAQRNGDVAGKQESIKKKMADLSKYQQSLEKVHLDLVQIETEIRNIKDNFRETHSRDLMEFEERMFTITTPTAEIREKLAAARAALKDLGSVNLMAPEEFQETKERYDFLSNQLADLQKARDDLARITAEIRAESSELFLTTYNRIKKNFHNMFRRLFGGGRAELRLSDPNHVLESGIEIYAQPPGKKLENITLLSGGEKSMTAVALLFATYMVKPSPFCFLDEIDAALDEQNVLRFVQLLREFGSTSQFVVITHNKKTVTGARTLLGVTMEESGVTKVISVRLENEEALDNPPEAAAEIEPIEDEDVEAETGMELPLGIDDPSQVTEADLRPIRAKRTGSAEPPSQETPVE
jgi:chromosome segregation protein